MLRHRHRVKNVSTTQGMPEIVGNHQELGEKHGMDSLPEPPKGTNPANSDFWLPEW